MTTPPTTQGSEASFYGLGIAPQLLDALKQLKFSKPTPIQHKAIPIALEGQDIIGIAQTGTGKTLAFGIPMIQRLAQVKGQGLVLLPTRELAIQAQQHLPSGGFQAEVRADNRRSVHVQPNSGAAPSPAYLDHVVSAAAEEVVALGIELDEVACAVHTSAALRI